MPQGIPIGFIAPSTLRTQDLWRELQSNGNWFPTSETMCYQTAPNRVAVGTEVNLSALAVCKTPINPNPTPFFADKATDQPKNGPHGYVGHKCPFSLSEEAQPRSRDCTIIDRRKKTIHSVQQSSATIQAYSDTHPGWIPSDNSDGPLHPGDRILCRSANVMLSGHGPEPS